MTRLPALLFVFTAGCIGNTAGLPTRPGAPEAAQTADVGPTPLQRLTTQEYLGTVQPLLGTNAAPVLVLPSDEVATAFSANVATLVGDTALAEYAQAADALAAAADMNQLLACQPSDANGTCVRASVLALGRRLYRRPLSAAEAQAYEAFFPTSADPNAWQGAMRDVLRTQLTSPNFLYKVELGVGSSALRPLAPFEVASRLSFLLFGSAPDNALLDLAQAGGLATPAQRMAQARLMMSDARFAGGLRNFHFQWLGLEDLPAQVKSPVMYPAFNANTALAMQQETADFANRVIRDGDGTLRSLLTSTTTTARAPLLDLYGLPSTTQQTSCVAPDLTAPTPASALTPPGVSTSLDTAMWSFNQIIASAFACDMTRFASLQYALADNDVWSYPALTGASTDGHHALTHDDTTLPSVSDALTKIHNLFSVYFVRLLDALDAVPEGPGTMLDNTLVVWGSEFGEGHSFDPVPFITAGGLGGALQTGRYLNYAPTVEHNRLLVSICNLMGAKNVMSHGNVDPGQGPLAGF